MAGDNHGGLFQEHRIVGIHIPGGYGADITISDVGDDVILDKAKIGCIERIAPLFQPGKAVAWEYTSINPTLGATLPERHSKERAVWSDDEAIKALNVCELGELENNCTAVDLLQGRYALVGAAAKLTIHFQIRLAKAETEQGQY